MLQWSETQGTDLIRFTFGDAGLVLMLVNEAKASLSSFPTLQPLGRVSYCNAVSGLPGSRCRQIVLLPGPAALSTFWQHGACKSKNWHLHPPRAEVGALGKQEADIAECLSLGTSQAYELQPSTASAQGSSEAARTLLLCSIPAFRKDYERLYSSQHYPTQ